MGNIVKIIREADYLNSQIKDKNDITTELRIWEEIRKKICMSQNARPESFTINNEKEKGEFNMIVANVLSNNEIDNYHKEIADLIQKRWIRSIQRYTCAITETIPLMTFKNP